MASTNGSFASTTRSGERDPGSEDGQNIEFDRASLQGAVMSLHARDVELTQAAAGTITAEHVTLQRSTAGAVLTKSAAADRSRVGILASPVVRGDVHTWLDLRTAFAAGLGFFVGKLIVDLIRRSLGR